MTKRNTPENGILEFGGLIYKTVQKNRGQFVVRRLEKYSNYIDFFIVINN